MVDCGFLVIGARQPTRHAARRFAVHACPARNQAVLVTRVYGVSMGAESAGKTPARSAAVQKGEASALPEDLKVLLSKQIARPIFAHDGASSVPATKQAEIDREFLSKDALAKLRDERSDEAQRAVQIASIMAEKVDEIVGGARAAVSSEFPGIDLPGGALYPEFRASACWRDFWHFTRIAHYAVALSLCRTESSQTENATAFLDPDGMEIMRQLYQCFEVPLDAMLCGVLNLKHQSRIAVRKELESDFSQQEIDSICNTCLDPSFDTLIASLEQFTHA